jgi:hypothetical protein
MPTLLEKALTTPIFLFQMGKVGSSTLQRTLSQHHRGCVVHAHRYADLTSRHRWLLACRRRLGLRILVICPVRDPLARNVSAFFQNFQRDTGYDINARDWSVDALTDLFLARYPHHVPLTWFDEHFLPTFGIDVLGSPFPRGSKSRTYRSGSIHVLVYRTDLQREEQLAVVSEFVGYPVDEWHYDNVAAEKPYADLYERFCREAVLPEDYISRVGRSRFCRHFWTESEIEEQASKWRARAQAAVLSG